MVLYDKVYPPSNEDDKKPKTRLQERLMKKLGEHAYPFFIEVSFSNTSSCDKL